MKCSVRLTPTMDHPDTRLEQMMLRVFLSSCCHVCTLASGEAIVYGRDAVCPQMLSMQPFKKCCCPLRPLVHSWVWVRGVVFCSVFVYPLWWIVRIVANRWRPLGLNIVKARRHLGRTRNLYGDTYPCQRQQKGTYTIHELLHLHLCLDSLERFA